MHVFACVFLNLSVMSFPKFVNMTKNNTPFFPILHVFAPLNDVRAYTAWSWKTTLITWICLRGWYPTSNTSGPGQSCERVLRHLFYACAYTLYLRGLHTSFNTVCNKICVDSTANLKSQTVAVSVRIKKTKGVVPHLGCNFWLTAKDFGCLLAATNKVEWV